MSGPFGLIIFKSLKKEGKENYFKNVSANNLTMVFVARSISAMFSGFLYSINPILPVVLVFISQIISSILIIFIFDNRTKSLSEEKSDFEQIKKSFRFIWKNKNLLKFLLIIFLLSELENIFWTLYQSFFPFLVLIKNQLDNLYFYLFILCNWIANYQKMQN